MIKQYYNKHRLEGRCLERGDKVYLILKKSYTKRPSKKLDFKEIGLFKVEERILTSNYRLSLLVLMKLQTNVFYISLLEPAPKNVKLAIDIKAENEEEECDVEEILDLWTINRQL
jgi:hypothetical protein